MLGLERRGNSALIVVVGVWEMNCKLECILSDMF